MTGSVSWFAARCEATMPKGESWAQCPAKAVAVVPVAQDQSGIFMRRMCRSHVRPRAANRQPDPEQ